MSGLDDLVADAMKRKLIPTVMEEARASVSLDKDAQGHDITQSLPPVPEPKLNSTGGITPDVSLVFLVNGVRCILTVHVQAGAKVEIATEPTKKAPKSGPKVKGIRGASTEESEAPEASEEVFDVTLPIGGDNLPEGWVNDPVVGATVGWTCPDHGKREERLSKVTGRYFTVCPECGKLAPK